MEVKRVIWETLGMMGFTFLVGMGVAYVIKILVEIFHFFRKDNVSNVVQDYKAKIAFENKRRADLKRVLSMIEKDTEKSVSKEKKEDDEINELIKYYNGEV